MLEEYKAYIKRDLKPKKIPMQPGVVLTKDDVPETPDPKEQKIYRSFVAKLQFVANWIRYDVSFAASQLARFCASAGVSHWAALHHVMGYLKNNPTFKLVYKSGHHSGLDGFADADWGNSESPRSTTGPCVGTINQFYRVVAIKNAKDDCAINCRSRVLFSI
jgi:hypothetical protein